MNLYRAQYKCYYILLLLLLGYYLLAGMRPLIYSEKKAAAKNIGWERTGHHIIYTRNTSNLQCPLLARDRSYYVLEWQMVNFSNSHTLL